jgi:DNA polymerase V
MAPVGRDCGSPALRNATPAPTASTGFGSPGTDSTVRRLDLNDALIQHPQATYMMRARGTAMAGAGIGDGDILIVDRALVARSGSIVIAVLEGELVCRRLAIGDGSVRLEVAAAGHAAAVLGPDEPLEVWGVVTSVVKSLAA